MKDKLGLKVPVPVSFCMVLLPFLEYSLLLYLQLDGLPNIFVKKE